MKKRISILAAAAAVLSSCGAASYTSSSGQRFEDGIYSRPRVEDTQKLMASKSETDELVQKTRSSEIYLSTDRTDGHRTDTLFIPEDKAAVINFSGTGTSVTVMDDPFEQVYFNTYPWTYYRPYTFSSFYWDPWYYGRYWGYYDPWYWGGWYRDPWYWGVGLAWDLWFYDPWFWGPAYMGTRTRMARTRPRTRRTQKGCVLRQQDLDRSKDVRIILSPPRVVLR